MLILFGNNILMDLVIYDKMFTIIKFCEIKRKRGTPFMTKVTFSHKRGTPFMTKVTFSHKAV